MCVAIELTWCCVVTFTIPTRAIQQYRPRAGCVKQALSSLIAVANRRGVKTLVPAILGLKKNSRTELPLAFQ